jgi:DNA-binding NtrC family response regulator
VTISGSHDDSTATALPASRTTRPIDVLLRIEAPGSPALVHKLGQGSSTLGSSETCEISVKSRTISRKHLELRPVPEGVSVRDLGSRNGTFYLGQRIEGMVLALGGSLVLGQDVRLTIDVDSQALEAMPPFEGSSYRGVLGQSLVMRQLFAVLRRLEGSLVNVLVEGESGVGKEVIARAVHEGSRVASGPFVAVNCGAIARELVASELFGHRRGAFTGAVEARRGAFEVADGGTLFLDEIGELPVEVQPMLLRALETGDIRAVGDDTTKRVKVRVVAATNRELDQRVQDGSFRADLFYRLAVVRLRVPPLRERPEDIDMLATHFAAADDATLPADILARLRARPYPGNARELRNAVQVYAALGTLPTVEPTAPGKPTSLRQLVDLSRPFLEQRDALVDEFTRHYLEALLTQTGGNQTLAAQVAGLDRTYLGRLITKVRKR